MTDSELLERAAQAAGLEYIKPTEGYSGALGLLVGHSSNAMRTQQWNPLTDDGDALRLAVRLRMAVRVEDYGAAARIGDDGALWWGCEAHLYDGIETATRRAIVRAAAMSTGASR